MRRIGLAALAARTAIAVLALGALAPRAGATTLSPWTEGGEARAGTLDLALSLLLPELSTTEAPGPPPQPADMAGAPDAAVTRMLPPPSPRALPPMGAAPLIRPGDLFRPAPGTGVRPGASPLATILVQRARRHAEAVRLFGPTGKPSKKQATLGLMAPGPPPSMVLWIFAGFAVASWLAHRVERWLYRHPTTPDRYSRRPKVNWAPGLRRRPRFRLPGFRVCRRYPVPS